ncbi:hypothetical protein MKZ38_006057 [Zalerion maritima]|uniref:Translation initiation factor eIF2B subunit delta n=1 Tax=Zalerion maritima TaxID=339359 RepID=A0AAD5WPV2_9PEZI|nr:hypothetical protein MKZ38_006057 [Zalerion maritima]
MATETNTGPTATPDGDAANRDAPTPTQTPVEKPVDDSSAKPEQEPEAKQDNKPKQKQQPSTAEAVGEIPGSISAGAPGSAKQLSNAEKKAQQKAEKAARRAKAKAEAPPPPKESPDQQKKGGRRASMHQGSRPEVKSGPREKKPVIPECFSHLSMAKRIPPSQTDKDVHPAVLALGQQMSSFSLTDSIGRLQGTLLALQKVISSYTTPQGSSFSRHFTPHALNPQIDYLSACRPMCFCMGSAVRWLKLKISKIDTDADDLEAKAVLQEEIEEFIMARIALADASVVVNAAEHIKDGDEIITFGSHRLVESTLIWALKDGEGKSFSVTVVDDPIDKSGLVLAEKLSEAGIKTKYAPSLGGLSTHILSPAAATSTPRSTKVLLGAESMFSNGTMYGRAGSSDVALAAKMSGIPVIALCHSFSFTERAATDSLTYNEIDPERCTDQEFRLLFDVTGDITTVVTDVGNAPPRSAMCVLKRWEDI